MTNLINHPKNLYKHGLKPECIEVLKIYDWLCFFHGEKKKLHIPGECKVENCDLTNVVIKTEIDDINCDVANGQIRIKSFSDESCDAYKLMSFACIVPVRVYIYPKDDEDCEYPEPICIFEFDLHILIKDILICLPELLDKKNILIEIKDWAIEAFLINDELFMDFEACFNLEIKGFTKLEISAQDCHPRGLIDSKTNLLDCDICLPNCECHDCCPPKPVHCPVVLPECSFEDTLKGCFSITEESSPQVLWEAVDLECQTWGSLCVSSKTGPYVLIRINGTDTYRINNGQTRSFTLQDLEKVEVIHPGGGGVIKGNYCIVVHYTRCL